MNQVVEVIEGRETVVRVSGDEESELRQLIELARTTGIGYYSYATRAEFIAALASELFNDGDIVRAAGLGYTYSTGATAIPDAPGFLPVDPPTVDHFGPDDDTAFAAAGVYGGEVRLRDRVYTLTDQAVIEGTHLTGVGYSFSAMNVTDVSDLSGSVIVCDFETATAESLIHIEQCGKLSKCLLYYPNQPATRPDPWTPTTTPWAITTGTISENARTVRDNDTGVEDVMILEFSHGLRLRKGGERGVFRNIRGNPFMVGLDADANYDITRFENINWWVYGGNANTRQTGEYEWLLNNRVGFRFGRIDGLMLSNSFVIDADIGIEFYPSDTGDSLDADGSNFFKVHGCYFDGCNTSVKLSGTFSTGTYPTGMFSNCTFQHHSLISGDEIVTSRETIIIESPFLFIGFDNCELLGGGWAREGSIVRVNASRGVVNFTGCWTSRFDSEATGAAGFVQTGAASRICLNDMKFFNINRQEVFPSGGLIDGGRTLSSGNVSVGSTGGLSLSPDAVGTLAGRTAYDSEAEGFVYLAYDQTPWEYYVRDGSSGTWRGPETFTGPGGPPGPAAINAFATQADAEAWLTTGPDDDLEFTIGTTRYLTAAGASDLPIADATWSGDLTFLHFGDGLTVTEDEVTDAITFAGTNGAKLIVGGPLTVNLTARQTFDGLDDLVIDLTGTTITEGSGTGPGWYFKNCTGVKIRNGDWTGNGATESWKQAVMGLGITDGDKTGASDALYASGVSVIGVKNLGTGFIKKGALISYIDSGTTYIHTCLADAALTAGANASVSIYPALATNLPLDRPIYIGEWNRNAVIDGAYTAGATSIVIRAPSASGVEVLTGDQFAPYPPQSSVVDTLPDYTNVVTVTSGAAFVADGLSWKATVTVSPLTADIETGQIITSLQDHRNNRYVPILFYGCDDCHVEGLHMDYARLHGVTFNACVNAPWDGVAPSTMANTNCSATGCEDTNGRAGAAYVGSWCENLKFTGNHVHTPFGNRVGVTAEKSTAVVLDGNKFPQLHRAGNINGGCINVSISDNDLDECTTGIWMANSCRNVTISRNRILLGSSSLYGILGFAGAETDDEGSGFATIRAGFLLIEGNDISGETSTANANYGSAIQIAPINNNTSAGVEDYPYFVSILNNKIDGASRHGINAILPAQGIIANNIITSVGADGIRATGPLSMEISGNIVQDAGMDVSASAYSISDGTDTTFQRNTAAILNSTGQDYGLSVTGTSTFAAYGDNILAGVSGATSGWADAPKRSTLPTYADNAAAVSGGLAVGQEYKTSAGAVRVVV